MIIINGNDFPYQHFKIAPIQMLESSQQEINYTAFISHFNVLFYEKACVKINVFTFFTAIDFVISMNFL
jgi:hypothetical protein